MNPATEFGLKDPWVRWQFNHAVGMLGRWVENKLAERTEKGSPKNTIEELLGLPLVNSKLFDSGFGQK